ncbi:MAG: methyltransferase [Candidatus Schekmanbacteria bacterium]|nr:methyltransferase [Candidatus Schekmanbacteria bacterium]
MVKHVPYAPGASPLLAEQAAALGRLACRLDDCAYEAIQLDLRGAAYYLRPYLFPAEQPEYARRVDRLPSLQRIFQQFFYLGRSVSVADLVAALGDDVVGTLAGLRLCALAHGRARLSPWYLGTYDGAKFFATSPHAAAGDDLVYVGTETYYLVRQMGAVRGGVLDLGCGTGLVGILAARQSLCREVWATDVSLRACWAAATNAALNGISTPHCVDCVDLYGEFATRRFDTVVFNPPFVIVPDGLDVHEAIAGGPLGIELAVRALRELPATVSRVVLVACSPGDASGPYLLEAVHELAALRPELSGTVKISGRRAFEPNYSREYAQRVAKGVGADGGRDLGYFSAEFHQMFREHLARNGITHEYGVSIDLRVPTGWSPAIHIVDTTRPV